MSRAIRTARTTRIAAVAIATAAAAVAMAGPASATWSVVGTDPATGQVGAAVASCTDLRDLTTTMALVPKTGGAVSVGPGADTAPLLLASALRSGSAPREVTAAAATGASSTSGLSQYGVAVIRGGAFAATGANAAKPSGALVSADGTTSVQGNGVASPAVLEATKRGFDAATGTLGARLVAALDAGAAAGGDRGCGGTARAASVVVLGTDSALFVPAASGTRADVSDLLGATDLTPEQLANQLAQREVLPAPRGAHAPELYLSSVVPSDGNALEVIDARYAAITAAAARKNTAASGEIVDPSYSQGLTIAVTILFGVLGLIIAALIISGLRRADRNDAALAEEDATGVRRAPFRGEVAQLFDVDLAAAIRRNREADRRRQVQKDRDLRDRERVWTTTW